MRPLSKVSLLVLTGVLLLALFMGVMQNNSQNVKVNVMVQESSFDPLFVKNLKVKIKSELEDIKISQPLTTKRALRKYFSDSFVDSFQYQWKDGASLDLKLNLKEPVSLYLENDEWSYIASDASKIKITGSESFLNLPTLRVKSLKKESYALEKSVLLLHFIEEKTKVLSHLEVSEILFEEDFITLYTEQNKVEVYLPLKKLEESVLRTESVLEYLKDNSIQAKNIDARFGKKVKVSIKKET